MTADLDGGDPLGPVLLIGAGRMGGALLQGWRASGAFHSVSC
jgi:pyrroline-5-carboxylate reductase